RSVFVQEMVGDQNEESFFLQRVVEHRFVDSGNPCGVDGDVAAGVFVFSGLRIASRTVWRQPSRKSGVSACRFSVDRADGYAVGHRSRLSYIVDSVLLCVLWRRVYGGAPYDEER